MNTEVKWRTAGIALLVAWFGSTLAFQVSGSPGGTYSPQDAAHYADPATYLTSIFSWTAAALSMLALPVFGYALRPIRGWAGELIWGLSLAATGAGVAGAYFAGGFVTALAESGPAIRAATPVPLVYTFGEIGNLMAATAPSFLIGAAALLLAIKGCLPTWLRVITVIGGLCAMAEPWYYPIVGIVAWVLCFGIWGIVRGSGRRQPLAEPALQR